MHALEERHADAVAPHAAKLRAGKVGRALCATLLGLVGLALVPVLALAQATEDVKAEMLFNIAKFVAWPLTASPSPDQMTFAILGEDDLAGVLAATLSTKTINGRKVFVRCVRRVDDVKDCQILYIAASEHHRIPEVLEALRGRSILTVADASGFASRGGMVDFVHEQDRVRFEINTESATRAKLKISARLLALARIVASAE